MINPIHRILSVRLGIIAALCSACAFAFCGCGEQDAESTEIELVLVTIGGQTGDTTREMARRFERDHPGIRVRVVVTPGQHYYVKSLTMVAGRAPVDVLWLGQGFGMFAARGALMDLTPLIEGDADFALDDYFQPVVDWYRYDEKLYGIPTGIDVEVLGFNRTHFHEAGLPEPNAAWTVHDMIAAGKRLTPAAEPGVQRTRMGLGFEQIPPEYYGLQLLTPDDTAFALNTPLGNEWLAMNQRYSVQEPILAARGDRESMDRLGAFIGGQVSITPVYTWDLVPLAAQMREPWDVTPVPVGPNGVRRAWASSAGFSIPYHSKHPQEAWLLLKYLASEAFQEQAINTRIPALTSLQPRFLAADDAPENRQVFLDSLEFLQPTPRIGALQEVTAEWQYWRERSILGQLPSEQALAEAERNINRILEYHRGP